MIEPAVTPPIDGEYSEQWQHVKYRHLILLDKDFIVFIDDDLDVDWQTTEAYDTRGHKNETQHNDILNAVARLEATPCSELPYSIRLQYKRLVGEGIARSLAHDYGNAKTILHTAEKYIRDRSEETSRYWYLTASTVMAALALAIGMLVDVGSDFPGPRDCCPRARRNVALCGGGRWVSRCALVGDRAQWKAEIRFLRWPEIALP